ncbi:thiamine biosynthetic bifunctional enzyme [Kickxella alabastrina]|uniref:Thiamine biosynthetic bifunctional enzyme n=1 Tax=Kickxella alabastrina TaxID=61397 RepID=A0ACC1IV42_9FUNG|nr:thiamine biosynthetic bifunctional enzyme [Kickxella alabastrina]
MKPDFNLTLYLVTDSGMVPADKTLAQIVDEAIQGGVTIVQLREKTADTGAFIALARSLQKVTKNYGVPLLINDRIDVALAIDADGVHIGQDDMSLVEARRILGPNKIIGMSVQTAAEAEAAMCDGADYLGIGVCFDTETKQISTDALRGPAGVRQVWEHALEVGPVRAVTIGGVNEYNAVHVLDYTRSAKGVPLEGVAVVSAIMAAEDPCAAAKVLRSQVSFAMERSWASKQATAYVDRSAASVCQAAAGVVARVRATDGARPLVQHMTNAVVMNDCANACLALGGSPIMAPAAEEQADLARNVSALVVNIGTLTSAQIPGIRAAMRCARLYNTPIVLDPVGMGISTFRKSFVYEILRDYGVHVIKANAGEVASLLGSDEVSMQGVDSIGAGFSDPAAAVSALSRRHRCIVVMTGRADYVSDGTSTFAVRNGHPMQACISGSGCMVGTAVATFIQTVAHEDPLAGALAGLVAVNVAAEHAAVSADVRGPGTFRPAFIDEMHRLSDDILLSEMRVERA